MFPEPFSVSPEQLKVRASAPDVRGWGKRRGWLWVSDPSHLSNLAQKGKAATYKVCVREVVRDPPKGRTQKAAASRREDRKAAQIRQGSGGGVAKGR